MITAVRAKGFKGLKFEQELGAKNIFFGPNGSGKSARKEALVLAINGSTGRQNSAVLDAYGKGDDSVEAGVQIGGKWFDREFKKAKTSVTQTHKINGKKVDKTKFATEMGKIIGTVSAFDIASFVAASDKGKIAAVFDLFPPEGDVAKVEEDIDALKTEVNARHAAIRAAEAMVAKLTASRAQTELPAGTLEQTTNELKDTKAAIQTVKDEIQNIRNEEAKKQAAAEAKAKAEAAAKKQAAEAAAKAAKDTERKVKVAVEETKKEVLSPARQAAEKEFLKKLPAKLRDQVIDPQKVASSSYDVGIEAIQRIIQAIGEMKGCSGCFIGMLAKSELKKINALKETAMVKF